MDEDKSGTVRDTAVAAMTAQLDNAKQTNLPRWILLILVIPVLVYDIIMVTAKSVFWLAVVTVMVQFKFLLVWIDTVCIICWYLNTLVERMARK